MADVYQIPTNGAPHSNDSDVTIAGKGKITANDVYQVPAGNGPIANGDSTLAGIGNPSGKRDVSFGGINASPSREVVIGSRGGQPVNNETRTE